MRSALIDTNVVSTLFSEANPNYHKCQRAIDDRLPLISFMTRAEVLLWPKVNGWGKRREGDLILHLSSFTTLYADDRTCELWSQVKRSAKNCGRPIETADAWIAATALQYEIPLITLNHRDFNFLDDLELIPIQDPATNG